MLNSVGASTQPCLTSFVTGTGSDYSPSFWARGSMPSRNCRTIAINLAGQQNYAIIFPKPITTYCVKCFGKVDKGHVEVHILFVAFLLELPSCKDNVYCSSVLPESILTFW